MVDVLQDKHQAIAKLCARFGVVRLDVFGSDFSRRLPPRRERPRSPGRVRPHGALRLGRRLLRSARGEVLPVTPGEDRSAASDFSDSGLSERDLQKLMSNLVQSEQGWVG